MNGVLRTAILFAVSTVALTSGVSSAFAAGTESSRRADDLTVTVDSRWAGSAHGGYYPIRIRVTNTAKPRQLTFVFRDTSNRPSKLPSVSRSTIVEQNATQQITLSVPMVTDANFGQLQVFENGRMHDSLTQNLSLPDAQRGGQDRPSLLVISSNPVDCARFEDAVNSLTAGVSGTPGSTVYYGGYGSGYGTRSNDYQVVPPILLPESWIDYSGLDVVAVPLAVLEKLPSAVRTALVQWVETGGTLLVYEVGGPAAESKDLARLLDLANRPTEFQKWYPAVPGDHRPITLVIDGTTGAGVPMVPGPMGPPPGVAVQEQPNQVNLANQTVWQVKEDTYSRVNLLAGSVFAFSGNPFPGAPVDWAWFLNAAGMGRNLKWTLRNGLSSRGRHDEFFQFLIPGVGAVPVFSFIILISIFAVVIGPVNYFLVWKRKQLYLLVVTIPLIAFVTSGVLFGYAVVADGFGVQSRLRTITLIDQHSKTAVSFNRISLYAGLAPSAGLKFSPETAVFPIWQEESGFDSGSVDWTETQHLASGFLRSRTPAQFETIQHHAERGRLEVQSPAAGGATLEISNGLEWDLGVVVVKDDQNRLFGGTNIPAGATAKLPIADNALLSKLTSPLADHPLQAPDGAVSNDWNPFFGGPRRYSPYYGYGGMPETPIAFKQSLLEQNLERLKHVTQDGISGGLPARTYIATVKKNPGIELGVSRSKERAGVHAVMGYY